MSCRSLQCKENKNWKFFYQLKTPESVREDNVRLQKFWQVISTFLYPSGATRIKFAADAFNLICGILETKQTNCTNICQFANGKPFLCIHKLCWEIQKNWWNIHSLCICSMAYLWIEDDNLKMIEQKTATVLTMLNLYYGNSLHHLSYNKKLLWAQCCAPKIKLCFSKYILNLQCYYFSYLWSTVRSNIKCIPSGLVFNKLLTIAIVGSSEHQQEQLTCKYLVNHFIWNEIALAVNEIEPVFLCKILTKNEFFIMALLNTVEDWQFSRLTSITTEPQPGAESQAMVAILFGRIGCWDASIHFFNFFFKTPSFPLP